MKGMACTFTMTEQHWLREGRDHTLVVPCNSDVLHMVGNNRFNMYKDTKVLIQMGVEMESSLYSTFKPLLFFFFFGVLLYFIEI